LPPYAQGIGVSRVNEEKRRLAGILAVDVVGYSAMVAADEPAALARVRALRTEIVEPLAAGHGGRVFKTMGDGFLLEFASAVQALRCALAIQETLRTRAEGVLLRIGVHQGEVVPEGDDLFGDGVIVAARLEPLAEPGGIVISSRVREDASGKMVLEVDDLGEPALKNIAAKIRAFRVRMADVPQEPAKPALTLPDKPSIAVLPFQNMSDDAEQEYFADGMVEDIITALSRIRWLFVIARNSSFTYKGHAVDIKQVGRELGVRYVLEGSVRKGGNRVRVTAQLVDAVTGTHLWGDRYDRDLSDIFAVQDEITASVAGVIEPALADAEQQRVLRKPPKSLDAWEAYQRGVWHFNKYAPEENQTALGFFRQAIGLDPNFAPGHYGYALADLWSIWNFSDRPFSEVQGTPRDEARIAVSLDDKDAMAHAVLAHIWMWNSEWEAAISEARAALTLNPNSAFVIGTLGCVLGFGGYRDEGLDRLRQAMRASPHDPLTWLWTTWRASIQFYSRQFDAALETGSQLARLRPEYGPVHGYIASSLALLGRRDEARAVLERAGSRPADPRWRQRPPWLRPEDFALRIEGLRLAAGETL
jgi:adenylate cyclase